RDRPEAVEEAVAPLRERERRLGREREGERLRRERLDEVEEARPIRDASGLLVLVLALVVDARADLEPEVEVERGRGIDRERLAPVDARPALEEGLDPDRVALAGGAEGRVTRLHVGRLVR